MKGIIKYIPYFYFAIAVLLLINSIQEFQREPESYRLFFSMETQSGTTYLTVRIVFVALIILAGFARLKRLKDESSKK
jgi:hypothetical protein